MADLRDSIVRPGSRVSPGAPISRVIEALLAQPESRVAHVVDADGKLLGTVSWRGVLKAAGARMGVRQEGFFSLVGLFRELDREHARDLMRAPVSVSMEETLREVLLKMEKFHENDLAIVDPEGRLLGEVNGMLLMRQALRTFESTEAADGRGAPGALGPPRAFAVCASRDPRAAWRRGTPEALVIDAALRLARGDRRGDGSKDGHVGRWRSLHFWFAHVV